MQLLLFVASVAMAIYLGSEHLTTTGIISIAFDWMAMVVLIIIYGACIKGRVLDNTKAFRQLIHMTFLCVLFESGCWMFDSLPAYRILNYLCNIGANCTLLIGFYVYYTFIQMSKDADAELYPWMKGFLRGTMIVGVLAEVFNCFGGYFYTINEAGVYLRSPYGSILGYIPFLILIAGCVQFVVRQKLRWQTKLSYLSYCILPFICSLWYTATGYPPTFYLAAAMSSLLIHSDIYVVQSRDAELLELDNAKKEAEFALSQNKLMLTQIRPHFMYNVLGSIEVLCELDPAKAGRAIHHFTHYFRSNMDVFKNEETIPFEKELEHIRNYVWLEEMRFADELVYQEEIETSDFRVPQLAIQPMVENAIKHGMMGREDGVLHVTLKAQENDTEYVIIVSDDGCGFDPAQSVPEDGRSHIGIQNAAYSLQMRMHGTMHIDSRIGAGTTVTIRIPKEKAGAKV